MYAGRWVGVGGPTRLAAETAGRMGPVGYFVCTPDGPK